jgi:hypothetical protein
MSADNDHPVVRQVQQLADELAESQALVAYLLVHVRRLCDACCNSGDERTRVIGLDYRTCAIRRTTAAGVDPDWAIAPRATLLRAGPPPQAKLN